MKRHSGMTLLEVLVALAIFSLVALALLQSLGQLSLGSAKLADKTWADWVAENQMTELRLQNVWPPLRWTYGESEQAGKKWYWRWRGIEEYRPEIRTLEIDVTDRPWEKDTMPVTTLRTWMVRR